MKGRYTKREFEDGLPQVQKWEAVCTFRGDDGKPCASIYKGDCASGQVRLHIQKFGIVHRHSDPFDAPRVETKNSGRRRSGEY